MSTIGGMRDAGAVMININEIVWDPSVYPRERWNTATVNRYAEAMGAGHRFPPMVLEYGTNRLLDGKHRELAYRKIGAQQVLVEWHVISADDEYSAKHYAARLSSRHGDRLLLRDLQTLAGEDFDPDRGGDPTRNVAAWGREFGLAEATVWGWVGRYVNKGLEERRTKEWRLARLGWTQHEIAASLGVSQATVSADIRNLESEETDIREMLAKGLPESEAAIRMNLPVDLVWAVKLDEMDDAQRLQALKIGVQPYDVWNWSTCHDLMGDAHPGRIPGELVSHVLYFFTKPGDLIVDPMAGSGTTLDACLLMGRKARGYDIDLHHERVDVEQHDLSTGWPATVEKARLVFWDPPYFHKVDSQYVDGSMSRLDAADYLCFFEERFSELRQLVRRDARLAFLMSDWDGENAERPEDRLGIFVWDYADLLRKTGWRLRRQIQVPLPTQLIHPDIVTKFRESRRLARLERYLLIAEPEEA